MIEMPQGWATDDDTPTAGLVSLSFQVQSDNDHAEPTTHLHNCSAIPAIPGEPHPAGFLRSFFFIPLEPRNTDGQARQRQEQHRSVQICV